MVTGVDRRGAVGGGDGDVDRARADGALTVRLVALTTVSVVPAVEPKSTAVAPVKPVPLTVTKVPPAAGPLVGLTLVTVGGPL